MRDGTADLGEAFATGRAIGKPTADSWYQHWRERADQVRAERGVRSGAINLLRVDAHEHHEHHDGADVHVHAGLAHLSPTN